MTPTSWPDWADQGQAAAITAAIDDYCQTHLAEAEAVLAYGSFVESRGTAFNDIDLLIVMPGDGPVESRDLIWSGFNLDMAIVPRAKLPDLGAISLRAGLPVGLFGLVHGIVIRGELPVLPTLRAMANTALAQLERQSRSALTRRGQMGKALLIRLDEDIDPARRAGLSLIAIAALLERDLVQASGGTWSTGKTLTTISAERPEIVAKYLQMFRIATAADPAPRRAMIQAMSRPQPDSRQASPQQGRSDQRG